MKVFKVIVTNGSKEYLTVAPLLESKARDRANKLHEQFPLAKITILSTKNPDDKWNECWVIDPIKQEVEVYISDDENYQ